MIRPGNPMPGVPGHGQPRPDVEVAPRQPSAAERARTLIEGNSSVALVIPGLVPEPGRVPVPLVPLRQSVGPDGDVFLLFPQDSPAVRAVRAATDDEAAVVLEVTDVAPVAVRHRIRGRAWLAGWLTPVPGAAFEAGTELLRLEPGEISLDDLWGTALVEPDEFAEAVADPLAGYEAELLQHLAAAHDTEVGLLCGLVEGYGGTCEGSVGSVGAVVGAVPLALDRFGLRVRFSAEGGTFDARFEFPEPVEGLEGARRAMRALFAAARDA